MLLIGVLIGRGDSNDQTTPARSSRSGRAGTTSTLSTGTESGGGGQTTPSSVTSEWPSGTNGFTIQVSSIGKSSATPESVDAAKQTAIDDGASDAAVLDSDLYSSLPPGNYIIYSGVYNNRKDAEAALGDLGDSVPNAPWSRSPARATQGRARSRNPTSARPRVDRRGHGPERAVAADRRCHGVGEMSPSVIERLKPYFKTRPRPRPGAAPPPAAAQNATAPATPAQPTPGAAPAPAPTPQAQPAKPKKRRGLRRKPRAAPAPAPQAAAPAQAPAQPSPADAGRGRPEARRGPGRSAGRRGAARQPARAALARVRPAAVRPRRPRVRDGDRATSFAPTLSPAKLRSYRPWTWS